MHVEGTVSQILKNKDPQLWTITPEASVYEALKLMAEKNIGAVFVLKEGRVLGILSERDYARKVILKGKTSKELHVQEIMSSPVISTQPGVSVDECMRIMTEHRIRHLPVLDNDQLVGVISIGDVVNYIISVQSAKIDQLESYFLGKYPGSP